MSANKPIDEPTGTETTGHVWDGIRELNTPLPRWWLWIFYATVIWAIGYIIAFPAIPLINSGTPGVLGFSSRANLESEVAMVEESRAVLDARLAADVLGRMEGRRAEEVMDLIATRGRPDGDAILESL